MPIEMTDYPEFSPLGVKETIEQVAAEVWFEADRDIEKDTAYKKAFKDGVDALEAALFASFRIV